LVDRSIGRRISEYAEPICVGARTIEDAGR
jgi:hypothetical protein